MPNDGKTINDRLYEMAGTLAALKEGQDRMNERLFDENLGGIIPILTHKVEALTTVQNEMKRSSTRDKAYVTGYGAAAGTALGFIIKWAGGKLGLHF